ncbi:MAG: type II toxin-antitoxin system HicB family antitoxin [Chloroflexi bacterium]|nr:type II toxin-antitoxin system HicB family antitoxin [Chloroflexota bacterium]MBI3733804.1 type II toxin-antitoxin system HicB family antitoxin [Chloroflexota bacterium]
MLKSYVASKIKAIVEVPGGCYDAVIEPNDEGGYLAEVPALACATEGRTVDEALAMLADAVEGWLAVAHEKGLKIPPPKPTPSTQAKV